MSKKSTARKKFVKKSQISVTRVTNFINGDAERAYSVGENFNTRNLL